MSASIARAEWLNRPDTRRVVAALEAVRPNASRFVGGCVRNAVMGLAADDVDIATQLLPDEVIAAAKAAGLGAAPTGVEHGTVTVVCNRHGFEVTTLRRDVTTDGRRATVAFTDDWTADAKRRDFRLNALYADFDGNVFDPTEGGLQDAKAGRVIFIGDAEMRIREDFLRILRFFRFNAWYAKGEIDEAGLAACARLAEGLDELSVERVWKETKKLFAASDPRAAMQAMERSGVRLRALPELTEERRLTQLIAMECDQFLLPDALTRIAAGLRDQMVARALARRLKLSNEEGARLAAALGREEHIVSFMSPREARRALYRLGQEAFKDRAKLAWAGDEKISTAPQWLALLALADAWRRPKFPLSGEEVMAAGVPSGPKVGRVLREVERWWIDSDFPDDKLSIVERLKAVAQAFA